MKRRVAAVWLVVLLLFWDEPAAWAAVAFHYLTKRSRP